jgi:hypothetical protein
MNLRNYNTAPHSGRDTNADPNCHECGGTGWRTLRLPSATRPRDTETRAERCGPCIAEQPSKKTVR